MTAYGNIVRSQVADLTLPATIWTSQGATVKNVAIFHLKKKSALQLTGLLEYLHDAFVKVVEEGMTYPQEGDMGRETFASYFFAEDVFVGVILPTKETNDVVEGEETTKGILDIKGTGSWEETVAGFYYVKPNYPGRSSHICNGGFVVPYINRGCGYGKTLGKSFLHYAPKLGYHGSVFNLVYVNNTASVRLWEGLGFTKAGRIPSAGRLRKKGEDGEEYVDAWVFYKSFLQ